MKPYDPSTSLRNETVKLRVAMLVSRFPIISETFVLDQVRGLIERGHEVDVFAVDGPADQAETRHEDFDRLQLHERTFSALKKPVSGWQRLKQTSFLLGRHAIQQPLCLGKWIGRQTFRKPLSLRSLDACSPMLLKNQYDILHCQFGTLGLHGIQLANLGAHFKRLVITFRGSDISSELRRRGRPFYDPILSQADVVMAVCDFFAQRLRALQCAKSKLFVHRSGIACDRFTFRKPQPIEGRPIRLITVGRLIEKKGMGYLIEAVAELVSQGRQIEYRIIGNGPLYDSYRQLVKQRGLEKTARFLGALPQHEIIRHLSECDLFVTANVTASNGDQEGPINTIKEALAVGLPVVATVHGGIPELVEDGVNGLLAPERDAKALQHRIAWLIDNQQQWPRLALAGRQRVERDYNLETWNDLLVERYREVLRKPHHVGSAAQHELRSRRTAA